MFFSVFFFGPQRLAGSTISTLLHDKINPKKFHVLSLGDTGFLQFFRVVSRDYGKPRHGETYSLNVVFVWLVVSLLGTELTYPTFRFPALWSR